MHLWAQLLIPVGEAMSLPKARFQAFTSFTNWVVEVLSDMRIYNLHSVRCPADYIPAHEVLMAWVSWQPWCPNSCTATKTDSASVHSAIVHNRSLHPKVTMPGTCRTPRTPDVAEFFFRPTCQLAANHVDLKVVTIMLYMLYLYISLSPTNSRFWLCKYITHFQ